MNDLTHTPTAASRSIVLLALTALLLLLGLTGCAHNAPGQPVAIGQSPSVLAAGADLAEAVALRSGEGR